MDDLGPHTGKWDYRDAQGNLIACVYRYDTPKGKEFRPLDVKARKRKAPDPRPLYNQPGIASASCVVLVEGEKCADALIAQKICATTAMNGANAPVEKTDWSPLQGKQIVIWPDNDAPGAAYASRVKDYLSSFGFTVAVVEVPPGKKEGWDAADAMDEGYDFIPILKAAFRGLRSDQATPPASPMPIPHHSLREMLADTSPMPLDVIAPRVLTPCGFLVFGGAPKVGVSRHAPAASFARIYPSGRNPISLSTRTIEPAAHRSLHPAGCARQSGHDAPAKDVAQRGRR
jgi:hypothetical protein